MNSVAQPLQMDKEQADRCRRNTGNASCLTQCFRPGSPELLPHFKGQTAHGVIVQVFRQPHFFVRLGFFDLILLPVNVSAVFEFDLNAFNESLVLQCFT